MTVRPSATLALVISVLIGQPAFADAAYGLLKETSVSEVRRVHDPELGIEATREIGDPMLRSVTQRLETTKLRKATVPLAAEGRFGFSAGFRGFRSLPGVSGTLWYHSSKRNPMFCIGSDMKATESLPLSGCYVDTDGNGEFDAVAYPGHSVDKALAKPVPYVVEDVVREVEITDPDSFSIEVRYQGLSKGEVKVSYLEFKGGLARPAFTQDVNYEMDPDGTTTIAFRGLRIKVLKATRESITYVVNQLPNPR
jgi:hypothetical protein